MIKPAPPENEDARLAALKAYQILDTAPEAGFDDLVTIAAAVCGMPMGSVSLIDADRQWFKSRLGLDAEQTPRDVAFCAHAILDPANVMVVPDATHDARFHDNPFVADDPGIRFYAGAPLVTPDGHAVGTLCVMDSQPRALESFQVDALSALSRQVTRLMELRRASRALHLQLQERGWYEQQLQQYQAELELQNAELTEQTRTDALTGLPNRRAFAAALQAAIDGGRALAVAIVDIDHFKTVNDVHGHAVGDEVLVAVAQSLRSASGGHGMVARLGGEEFAWLLTDIDPERARLNCEYLRESVHHASQSLPVTVSLGLAAHADGETGPALLHRADLALYEAKRLGRDRVAVAG